MLYLIGGASRAGKTKLAQRLLSSAGVPWFSLDTLRVGLARGFPELKFDPEFDDLAEADRLWPLVRAMSESLIATGPTECLEGVCLRPQQVALLLADFPKQVRACFLGYPNISADLKASQVLAHAGGINDWLSGQSVEAIKEWLTAGIERSRQFEDECRVNGIPFIDTGGQFEMALAKAEESLVALEIANVRSRRGLRSAFHCEHFSVASARLHPAVQKACSTPSGAAR